MRSLGGEDQVLERLRRGLARAGNRYLGDDAAFLRPAGDIAITVDQHVEGVHFRVGHDVGAWAERLVRVTLSDVAAVGGKPGWALLAVSGVRGAELDRLLATVALSCRRFGAALAGGDISGGDRAGASLTVAARRPPRGRWVRRSGGRAGDRLWLGDSVGEAALGRLLLEPFDGDEEATFAALPRGLHGAARRAIARHRSPRPQLELGRWLGRRRRGAAIDVSDGLALDLHRLCRESGVGAVVEGDALPFPPVGEALASHLGADLLDLALGAGEDYVLLFALPPGVRAPRGCTEIGELTAARRVRLRLQGTTRPLSPRGWDHLRLE